MSSRAVYKTKMDDAECLSEALKDLAGPSNVNSRESGTVSATVHGRLISFRKGTDGMYEATMAGESQRALVGVIVPDVNEGTTVYKLGQLYGKAKIMKAMRSIKGSVVKDEVDETGTVQIRIRTISFE